MFAKILSRHRRTLLLAPLLFSFSAAFGSSDIENSLVEAVDPDADADPKKYDSVVDHAAPELSLDERLQAIKREALALNRDLLILKEELQFPANTQVAVFLSVDAANLFSLDAVNVKIDDKVVANHLYTEKQTSALVRGGIQKLHLGNIKAGEHELVAVFTGRGPRGRDFRRAASYQFTKGNNAKYLELKITDSDRSKQPEFEIKDWD